MSTGTASKIAVIVFLFLVSIMQVSAFSTISLGGARHLVRLLADLLADQIGIGKELSGVGALGTLGLTSLLLTLAGYWAGRYGETTGRGRPHAPLVAAVAATVFVEVGGYLLDSLLGGAVDVRSVLLAVPAAVIWNTNAVGELMPLMEAAPEEAPPELISGDRPR